MRRVAQIVLLAALAAVDASASELADAKWLRLELSTSPSPLDALAISPERAQELLATNAGYVDLSMRIESHLRADGIQEETFSQVRRYLSDAGTEEAGDLEFWVMPSHEDAVIERAYVLRPDGSRTSIDPHTIQILPDLQPRVFSNIRRVVVPLSGLTRDATAVFVWRKRFRARDWPLPRSARYGLQTFHPVEKLHIEHRWDAAVATPTWITNDPDLGCTPREHGLVCIKERIAAAPMDPDLRSYFDETPDLVVAETLTWTQIATRVRDVVEAKIATGLPAGTVERIVGSAATPDEKWRRIFEFVANEVRYLGLEHGTDAVVPRPPAVTLERRFGDCKDKVSLLLALARKAGIDAYPVLVSTENFDLASIVAPSTGYFNHMIACRDTAAGRACVDPTVASIAPEETLAALAGAVLLELRPDTEGPGQLVQPRYASEVEIEGVTRIACDGSRHAKIERKLHGLAEVNYRQALKEMAPDERKRMLAEEYRQLVSLVVTPTFGIEGLRNPAEALVLSSEAATPASSPLGKGPSIRDGDPWTIFHGVSLRSFNHHFSYWNPGTRVRSTLRYDLCEGASAKFLGAKLDLASRFGRYERSYARGPSSVTVMSTLEVPSSRVPPAEIPEFNRFLETALDQSDIWFRLDGR